MKRTIKNYVKEVGKMWIIKLISKRRGGRHFHHHFPIKNKSKVKAYIMKTSIVKLLRGENKR